MVGMGFSWNAAWMIAKKEKTFKWFFNARNFKRKSGNPLKRGGGMYI
jgi:hypothetical protein